MAEKTHFQLDKLTVTENKIVVGNATVFYSSVSSTSIYEGRPYVGVGIAGIIGVVGVFFMAYTMSASTRMIGSSMSAKPVISVTPFLLSALPFVAMAIFGFSYRIKCLFLGINGRPVAVLKSKQLFELEVAQRAIEGAKRAYEAKAKNP